MVIEVKPLQPRKQSPPNEVTDEGMVIEVKPLQMEKQSVTNDVSYLFATLYSICYLAFLSYVLFPLYC